MQMQIKKGTLVACRSNNVFYAFGIVNNDGQTFLTRHEELEKRYFVRMIWPNQPPHEVIEEMQEQDLLALAQDANFDDPAQMQTQLPEVLLKVLRENDELKSNPNTLKAEILKKDQTIAKLAKKLKFLREAALQDPDGILV